jgi:hypothetical protein
MALEVRISAALFSWEVKVHFLFHNCSVSYVEAEVLDVPSRLG